MAIENKRTITPDTISGDELNHEIELRPKKLEEFIGQQKVIRNIELMMGSSRLRRKPIDHTLFSGPPGLGKTSLAYILSKELGVKLHSITATLVERKSDIVTLLSNLEERDILFIDEIHRLSAAIEEILYSVMEDYRLDVIIGNGVSSKVVSIDIPPFTLIGATTKSGMLSRPLRDRFIAQLSFDYYNQNELSVIVRESAKKMLLELDKDLELMVALVSRGTPRIANRILRRIRDYAVVRRVTKLRTEDIQEVLQLLGIDSLGLDDMDRKILLTIERQFRGGPVGINALSIAVSEHRETLENIYEPYLMENGFLMRTNRGRVISEKGKEYISSFS
ncbi:MAG: Holliday junction branch migration DNA helicase RuvB [Oligoflexia bacterium]|nr:Holliday junction branch migration DNA helicase RuvB [Oligoflexia bacterium]